MAHHLGGKAVQTALQLKQVGLHLPHTLAVVCLVGVHFALELKDLALRLKDAFAQPAVLFFEIEVVLQHHTQQLPRRLLSGKDDLLAVRQGEERLGNQVCQLRPAVGFVRPVDDGLPLSGLRSVLCL